MLITIPDQSISKVKTVFFMHTVVELVLINLCTSLFMIVS